MADIPFTDQYISITGDSGAQIQIRFRDLVELVNEGIYCVNSNGVLVFVNERFCKTLGFQPTEILGRSVFDLVYGDENVKILKPNWIYGKRVYRTTMIFC